MEGPQIRLLVTFFCLFMATIFTIMAVSGPKDFAWSTYSVETTVGLTTVTSDVSLGLTKVRTCINDDCDEDSYGDCDGDDCDCKESGQAAQGMMGTLLFLQLAFVVVFALQKVNASRKCLPEGIVNMTVKGLYLLVVVFGFILSVAAVAHWNNRCHNYLENDAPVSLDDVDHGPGWAVSVVVILFTLGMAVGGKDVLLTRGTAETGGNAELPS